MVVRSKVDAARMSSAEVTRTMAELRASGESPFSIDEDFLRREVRALHVAGQLQQHLPSMMAGKQRGVPNLSGHEGRWSALSTGFCLQFEE